MNKSLISNNRKSTKTSAYKRQSGPVYSQMSKIKLLNAEIQYCLKPATRLYYNQDNIKPISSTIFYFTFFQHFYHILMCIRRPQGRGFESARKHIASCIYELQCVLSSSEFLRAKDDLEVETTASGRQPIGFDTSLNSRLSAPTPPRAIKVLTWKEVRSKKLFHDLWFHQTQFSCFVFSRRLLNIS